MKFDLIRPCKLCPFRRDCLRGWLGEARAGEIAGSLGWDGGTFQCHETTDWDEEMGEPSRDENTQHCAGALIVMERTETPSQMVRIAERLGLYDRRRLDMEAPVFGSFEEFVEHHSEPLGSRKE